MSARPLRRALRGLRLEADAALDPQWGIRRDLMGDFALACQEAVRRRLVMVAGRPGA